MSLSAEEKYLPCVMSRLCDDDPSSNVDRNTRYVSIEKIKFEILDNISQILNSKSHPSFDDIKSDWDIEHSVLCYGLKDFCGRTNSAEIMSEIRSQIIEQLKYFEPRLVASTIKVELDSSKDLTHHNFSVSFKISAEFSVSSIKGEFGCVSFLDLESGLAEVVMNE